MKMISKIIPTLLLTLASLTSCGGHNHTFSEQFSYDETNHWRVATCEHTDLTKDLAPHTYDESGKCTVCGQVRPHVHTYSDEWSANATQHWHAATCGHTELTKDLADHDFDENYICKICKFTAFGDKSYYIRDVLDMSGAEFLDTIIKVPQAIIDMLPGAIQMYKYIFYYYSKDLKNNDVIMSACVTVPFIEDELYVNGLVVDSHPTLTDLHEAPTARWDKYIINAFAGNLILQCDLMGFGIQWDKPTDYHCKHLLARNTIDAMFACFDLLKDVLDIDCSKLPMFNLGYSQGGYSSMALLRYMETEATELEKSKIKFEHTYSGSGAYDINVMFDECFRIDDYQYCQYLIKGILTTYAYHPECYGSLTVEDYLTDYGKLFLDPLNRKDNYALNRVLKMTDEDGYPMYQGPKSVFNQEYLDPESELNKAVVRACELENLLDGKWMPKGDLDLFYTPYDTMVTPKCSEKAIELFDGLDNVTVHEAILPVDHQDYGTTFYVSTLLIFIARYALSD